MLNPELKPLIPKLTEGEIGRYSRLLESVFSREPKAKDAYNSITPEKDIAFSLSDPLPDIFREDIFSYSEIICRNDNDKSMLRDHLKSYNRGDAADLLVTTMIEYNRKPKDEIAIEAIGQGMEFFKQVTGFNIAVVSENDLKNLLPQSSYPRSIDFLCYLLEIRNNFLKTQNEGMEPVQFDNADHKDMAKRRLLKFSLALASKKDSVVITGDVPSGFSTLEVISAFQALCGYSLNQDLAREDPQF